MKSAVVHFNDQYIEIISWNHGGASVINLDFTPIYLPVDVDMQSLGRSILIALIESKKVPPESIKEFIFSPITQSKIESRTKFVMEQYGYKTKRKLFKNMRSVIVSLVSHQLEISPTHQDGLDYSFTDIDNFYDFILDKNCIDRVLGETVKLAYEKCTSIY